MYRTVLLTIGTAAALFNPAYGLPQTRLPSSTATAGVASPTPAPGNNSPPTKEVVHDVINNVLCTDPLTGTITNYESHNIDIDDADSVPKHKLAKRGNCFANTREGYLDYYEDPPSLDQMVRPTRDRSMAGNHYNSYRPHDDPSVMGSMNSVQNVGNAQSPDENLVAEPSVEESIEINMVEEGGLQDGGDGFDNQMDEFDGDGLEPGALDFERGIVGVRGGVGGGLNGGFGVRANTQRRRPLLDINAIIQNILTERRADDEAYVDEFRAHSRPEDSNPINLNDSQYSLIDEGTLDVLARHTAEELAANYDNIGHPGDGDDNPDATDVPLESVPTGEESDFPDIGDETMQLLWGDGRADIGSMRRRGD